MAPDDASTVRSAGKTSSSSMMILADLVAAKLGPGFERLLAAIAPRPPERCWQSKASRLARNGRDWHTLLEFCGLGRTRLMIDEDGVYDPRLVNDRLLLGMKGTFSELELSILRQRSQEALRLKARRGDLHTTRCSRLSARRRTIAWSRTPIAVSARRSILVFRKFGEIGSVRQVALVAAAGAHRAADRRPWS